jgi:hypothetical protein
MGWDDANIDLWLRVGVLPNLVRNSLLNYKALMNEVEYMCNGGEMTKQAEVFLNHHAAKLAMIRTHRARTRLQLVWMSYTYLRDARAAKFGSQTLQSKQTDTLRLELTSLCEMQTNRGNRNNRKETNKAATIIRLAEEATISRIMEEDHPTPTIIMVLLRVAARVICNVPGARARKSTPIPDDGGALSKNLRTQCPARWQRPAKSS